MSNSETSIKERIARLEEITKSQCKDINRMNNSIERLTIAINKSNSANGRIKRNETAITSIDSRVSSLEQIKWKVLGALTAATFLATTGVEMLGF